MSYFFDTSYFNTDDGHSRKYTVVAVTGDGVILRPVIDDSGDPVPSYWKEFIRGRIGDASHDAPITVHLTQLPSEVTVVDAYVEYSVEFPRVEVHCGDVVIDVSDMVACNHPNPETPGLYALDFTLSVGGAPAEPVWRSWLSIDEPPLLRRIITPWNRENRVIADLNRLVLEPQFMEALYEEGVPLYNFQQANAPAAVSQFNMLKYRNSRIFAKGGRLFVSGPRLPVGTEVYVDGVRHVLGTSILCPPFNRSGRYTTGDVVTYGGSMYYALSDIPVDGGDSAIPGGVYTDSTGTVQDCWLKGCFYIVDAPSVADGECTVTSLWGVVDVGGYLFKMDLLRAVPVRHYWGHYDRKYFYDYAPGDLVSVVSDNVISLYQRNDTSIAEKGTEETYRPGHYLNPHWVEVYSASNSTSLRDPAIIPYSNAANAVVAKTYPVREEAFRIYSRLVGIPSELVSALGTKYSVLLWALLYRTRETFPGIRTAMRAIGMDIPDLHRVYPSVIYSVEGTDIDNIYSEIAAVKQIAKSVEADKVWAGDGVPDMSDSDPRNVVPAFMGIPWIRYSREGEKPDTVWRYDGTEWKEYYSFRHVGTDRGSSTYDYGVNNRYYRATANLLDRLARECAVDMGDGLQWIDHNYISGISAALAELLHYEIPIYIYFRLKIRMAAIGHASVTGSSGGVGLYDAWGGYVGMKLFPGKYFDYLNVTLRECYPKVLYSYERLDGQSDDSEWTEYTDYSQEDGYRYYAFGRPVYVRMRFVAGADGVTPVEVAYTPPEGYVPEGQRDGKWTSRFTIGCIGDPDSPGTGNYMQTAQGYTGFRDATCMASGSDLYLCKGIVGITMRVAPSNLHVEAEALQWQYYLGDGDRWDMDEVTPFAGWQSVDVELFGYWSGSVEAYLSAVAKVTDSSGTVYSAVSGDVLSVGALSGSVAYLWDGAGRVIGMLQFGYNADMLAAGESGAAIKVTFSQENVI